MIELNDDKIRPVKERFMSAGWGDDYYGILRMQHHRSVSFSMVEGRRQNMNRSVFEGMGCQIYRKNGASSFVTTDQIDAASLDRCLKDAFALCPVEEETRDIPAEDLFSADPLVNSQFPEISQGIDAVPMSEAGDRLLDFHCELKNDAEKMSASTGFSISLNEWRILRSDGSDVHFTIPRSMFRHSVSIQNNGKNYTLTVPFIGNDYRPLIDENIKEIIRRRVKERIAILNELPQAPNIEYGSYPIIIDAHLTGGLVHEAFGHAAESDAVFRGSVLSKNGRFQKGLRVGPDYLSITDGPLEKDWAYQPYSSNGFIRQDVAIVRKGVLEAALSDAFTARPVGVAASGSERAESYAAVPIPRMSNIRLELSDIVPWDVDFQDVSAQALYDFLIQNELVEPSREYLYLSGYKGGQVNSTSGDFVFNCAMIYRFKDHRATLHKPAVFSGNIFSVLDSVRSGVGRLHIRRAGMCGKQGQQVPSSGGGPSFTMIDAHPEIRIGGQ